MSSAKTVLVTGAGSGIGRATAVAFGKQQANVIINFHSDEKEAGDVLQEVEQAGGKGMIIKADISREAEVTALFQKATAKFPVIDILVNNAGIQRDNPISSMTLEEWRKVIDVNLTGHFLCAREAIRHFRKNRKASPKGCTGNIIFVSSVHDLIPWAGHVNYASSKGGLSMFMKSLAMEVAPDKIRVNALSPGAIRTDINESVWSDPEKEKDLLKLIPYQRIGDPEDVAEVATWLGSDASDYITGTTIYIDGGMTLYPAFENNG